MTFNFWKGHTTQSGVPFRGASSGALRGSAACAGLFFFISFAGCATTGLRFTSDTDPDVMNALRVLPEDTKPPKLLRDVIAPSPGYPSGSVHEALLDGIVTSRGDVKVIKIAKTTDAAYASACVRAVQQWRYEPARREGGTAVGVHTRFSCSVRTP